MPELLQELPKRKTGVGRPADPARIMLMNTILDGRPWKIVRGVDYNCTTGSIIASSAYWADKRGLKIMTRNQTKGSVTIQAVPKG